MSAKIVQSQILFVLFLLQVMSSYALDWHRGIMQIDQSDPSVQMRKYGAASQLFLEFDQPFQMTDLAQFSSESEAVMHFRLSTGMVAKWQGPGAFSIDRFEHSWLPISLDAGEREYTRALLYLKRGLLFINAEQASDTATLVIETPLGTLFSQNAIFAIDLESFKESEKKNCTLYCFSGSITFEGLDGAVYKLSQGNKLALLLKEGLLKGNTIIFDASDRILWDQFKRQRKQFTDPYQFPKVSIPEVKDGAESVSEEAPARARDYFHMPVLPATPSFN